MIGDFDFSEGLTYIALSLRQVYSAAEQGVFFEALHDKTDADEWKIFTRESVRCQRWGKFLPTVPDLMDALAEFGGAPPVNSEAVAAYERVLESGTRSPEGTTWSFRGVLESCGRAAAEAFLEAGGHNAFATTWDEAKRRERFLATYVATARADPQTRALPPGPDQKQITAGESTETPISRERAAEILERLAGIHASESNLKFKPYKLTDDERAARSALLQRQAREIQEQPEPEPAA